VRLSAEYGEAVCDFGFDVRADDLLYTCCGFRDWWDLVREGGDLDINEVREACVEDAGENVSMRRRIEAVVVGLDVPLSVMPDSRSTYASWSCGGRRKGSHLHVLYIPLAIREHVGG